MTSDDVERRLTIIETKVDALISSQGKVSMPISALVLLWSILVTAVGAVVFVARLDARVGELTARISETTHALEQHVSQPWHAAAGEKYKAVDDRVNRVEDRLRDVEKHRP